ncbi:Glycerophosphocholine phosphodiesterase [Lobulomyces angularis]|nr:Glycerophosphocholine phosphodiesterase [Lobulomyces angularis]
MKFGSYLQQHAVSEWQSMYINYKKLKKLIKKVKSLSNDVIENTGDSEFRNIIRPESLFFHIVSTSDKPWESKFFIELDQQVSKVENFFSEQFKIAICRFNLINEQVDVYLKLKNEKLQKVELSKEVEFASTLEKDLKSMKNKLKNLFSKNPNKEFENVLNRDTNASNSSSSKNRAMEFNLLNDPNTSPSSNDEIVIEDLYQFDQEIINCGRISKYITNDCCGSEDHSSNDNLNQQEDCVKIDLRRIVLPKKNLISESLAKARHLIKHAILENYRFLNLLKSFKVLNTTAILKILKKFDKINIKIQKNFLDKTELSCKSNIVCHCRKFSTLIEKDGIFLTKDKDINEVNTKTEELFVNFTEVKRRKAMKRLRLPQEKNNSKINTEVS